MTRPRCAAIVPAYNEVEGIGKVLAALRDCPELMAIVVVDDGSTDGTEAAVRAAATIDPRVALLSLGVNRGKGQAVLAGLEATDAEIILLLDADLAHLRGEHLTALLAPVLEGRADMSVGLFRHGAWNTDLGHRLAPALSGQRALRRELLRQVCPVAAAGYGLEMALTQTARRAGARVVTVALPGVAHPPCERHRGFRVGLATRARMYREVGRAWLLARPARPRASQSRLWQSALLTVALLAGGSSLAYHRWRTLPGRLPEITEPLRLAEYRRLLVIAPHPDDEVLGAGGLIQGALARGAEVRVALVTNGDGQWLGPLSAEGRLTPRPADYQALGRQRQREAVAALATLGLPAAQVTCLGYPDRNVGDLWRRDWFSSPLQATYTRATRSPYPVTANPDAVYRGADLLADLRRIYAAFRPDLVVLPHPSDAHPDHAAVAGFAWLALLLERRPADPPPTALGYLIHYGSYPSPRGDHPQADLRPPVCLAHGDVWTWYRLTAEELRRKAEALACHASQLRLMSRLLPSFVRESELFVPLPVVSLAPAGDENTVVFADAIEESARRLLVAGGDLVALRVTRLEDRLQVEALTRGHSLRGLTYRLRLKLPDGREVDRQPPAPSGARSHVVAATWDLAELGYPPAVAVAADIRRGVPVDSTAWHVVGLDDH